MNPTDKSSFAEYRPFDPECQAAVDELFPVGCYAPCRDNNSCHLW